MALHTGKCEERDGDYFGPVVNRTARLEAIAHGGQVVISRSTVDIVRRLLPDGVSLCDLGIHRLKDLDRPEEVFQLDIEGLEAEFPPLRSLDNPEMLNNLPRTVSSFIGRAKEMAEVRRILGQSRLVTLTGPGGAGKTRLGLQVAADLLDGSGDGVWLVDLAPLTDPEAVPGAVARVLGIKEQAGFPMHDALVEALADQDLLLILDNCEHLIGACAKLAETLLRGCPKVHVIATSREPLGIDGERIFRVPSLGLPTHDAEDLAGLVASEAGELFLERARAQLPEFGLNEENAPLVAAVCRRLDGMPIALELAAARLRSMSLVHLHERLDQRFLLLTGGNRTALPRQQTLRAVVDWSYDLLNASEQAALRRLSVFVGGFDFDTAEAVCGFGEIDAFDVADLLGSLVDKSLVQAETTGGDVRYRLLETIRQYAAELLRGGDLSEAGEARDAHARAFLDLAESVEPRLSGPDQKRWLDRLDQELGNLHAAFEHFVATPGGAASALHMGVALRGFWSARGHCQEGLELLKSALDLPEVAAPTALRAASLCAIGTLANHWGDTANGLRSLEEGLAIARSLRDVAFVAEYLYEIAFIHYKQGDYGLANALLDEAYEVAVSTGDERLIASALRWRAGTNQNDPAQRRADLVAALGYFRRVGDIGWVIKVLEDLALLELNDSKFEAARSNYEEALTAATELGDMYAQPNVLQNLGLIAVLQGDVPTASRYFVDSLKLTRRLNLQGVLPYNLLGLSLCASEMGDYERAARLHGGADALLEVLQEAFEPLEYGIRVRDHDQLRLMMGGPMFDAAYASGRLMGHVELTELGLRPPFDGSVVVPDGGGAEQSHLQR
jgi:predicted ATPase